jgi:hypothetical protein
MKAGLQFSGKMPILYPISNALKPFITITLPWALIFWAFIPAAAQTASGVVNSYYAVASLDVPTNSMMVDDATGLSAGEAVLLIQSKGATIDQTNAATFGNITALGSAGNYEFNIVCNVIGNQVWLKAPFANSYDATGNVQLVGIPAYASVTISGTVNSTPRYRGYRCDRFDPPECRYRC